jgi:hypothetical protein
LIGLWYDAVPPRAARFFFASEWIMALDIFIDFAAGGAPVGGSSTPVQGDSAHTTYPNTVSVVAFTLGVQNPITISAVGTADLPHKQLGPPDACRLVGSPGFLTHALCLDPERSP